MAAAAAAAARQGIRSVAIIGGGIGGLVLAHALRKRAPAIAVTVYDRDASPTARAQGYEIGLNADGLAGLDTVAFPALEAYLAKRDRQLTGFAVTNELLKPLAILGGSARLAPRSAVVNRAELRNVLTEGVDLRWNKRCIRYELAPSATPDAPDDGSGVTLHFEDGTTATADVAVIANGARSELARQRCPQLEVEPVPVINTTAAAPTYPTAATHPLLAQLLETNLVRVLGPHGYTFLLIPHRLPDTTERQVLWVLTQPAANDVPTEAAALVQQAADIALHHFHPELHALIASTPPELVLLGFRNLVSAVPKGSDLLAPANAVTMLGDAVHPMTTHGGLGANTAIQDAIDLADALVAPDWRAAIDVYQRKMLQRGYANVKGSLRSTLTITDASIFGQYKRSAIFWTIGRIMALMRLIP